MRYIGGDAKHPIRICLRIRQQHLFEVKPCGFDKDRLRLAKFRGCRLNSLWRACRNLYQVNDGGGQGAPAQTEALAWSALQGQSSFQNLCRR